MRNSFYGLMALALCLTTSCSNEETDNGMNGQAVMFASGVNRFETRVNDTGDQWLQGDEVGIYMFDASKKALKSNIKHSAATAGASTTFQTSDVMYYPTDGSAVDFMAYHPYSESVSTEYPINLSVQTNQTALDLMYAVSGQSYTQTSGTAVSLTFNHQLVKVIINVTAEESVGDISNAELTLKGMNTTAKFNLLTAELSDEAGAADITPYKSSVANRYEAVLLPLAAFTAEHIVEFKVGEKVYKWTISENDGNITQFKSGFKYTFNVNLTSTGTDVEVEPEQGGSVNPWTPDGGDGTANPDDTEEPEEPGDAEEITVTTTDELLAALTNIADGGKILIDPTNPYYFNNLSELSVYSAASVAIGKSVTLEGKDATNRARINAKLFEVKGVDINLVVRNVEFSGYTVDGTTGISTETASSTTASYFIDINATGSVKNLTIENCFVYGIYNGVVRANRAADALYGNVTIVNNRFYNIGGNNGGLVACHADGTKGGTWVIQNNTIHGVGQGFYETASNKKTIVFSKAATTLSATISNNTFVGVYSGTNNYFIDSGDGSSAAGTFVIEKNIVAFMDGTVASRGPRLGTGTVTLKDNAVYPLVWTNIGKTYTETNTVAATSNPFTVDVVGLISLDADFTPQATLKANGWGDSRWLK